MRPDRLAPFVLPLLLLLGASCAPYDVSIRLTLEGSEALALTSGGGYLIELRDANGARIPGLQPRFVSFAEGKQSVGVLISSFTPEAKQAVTDGRSAPAILRVEARARADAPPLALGATRVRVQRNRPVEATVVLRADPRPLGQGFELRYATDWPALARGDIAASDSSVSVERSPEAPEGLAFHLWICTPECETGRERWLGEVTPALATGRADLFFVGDDEALVAQPHTLRITAEEASISGDSLAAPLGFQVASGQLQEARRVDLEALVSTREENIQGQLQVVPADATRIARALDITATHGAFAATAGRDDTYIRSHTGHTFWTLASGAPGAPALPTQPPLPDDLDQRGLLGSDTVQGRLLRLDEEATAAAELTASTEVAAAALDLASTAAELRGAICTSWALSISILMGSCTAPVPPGCAADVCSGITVPRTGLSPSAEQNLLALTTASTRIGLLDDGAEGNPLIDALERMTRFTATAADAGP